MESKHEIPDITRKPFECDSDYEARLIRSFHSLEAVLKDRDRQLAIWEANEPCEECGEKHVCGVQSQLVEARSQIEALKSVEKKWNTLLNTLQDDPEYCSADKLLDAFIRAQELSNDKIAALEAQLADYGKPVTDEEWDCKYDRHMMNRQEVNDLIASRTQSRQGAPMSERSAGE